MRRSTFWAWASKTFGYSMMSVGRHTLKPKPSGLGAVTNVGCFLYNPYLVGGESHTQYAVRDSCTFERDLV